MVKLGCRPTSSAWRRRMRAAIEWKVPSPAHPFRHAADDGGDTLLHLARGLVGEGHRQDLPGPGFAEIEQMGDPRGQHPGLAGAGAGQHQYRAVGGLDRLALFGVQPVQIGRGRHGGRGPGRGRRGRGQRGRGRRLVPAGGVERIAGHAQACGFGRRPMTRPSAGGRGRPAWAAPMSPKSRIRCGGMAAVRR